MFVNSISDTSLHWSCERNDALTSVLIRVSGTATALTSGLEVIPKTEKERKKGCHAPNVSECPVSNWERKSFSIQLPNQSHVFYLISEDAGMEGSVLYSRLVR